MKDRELLRRVLLLTVAPAVVVGAALLCYMRFIHPLRVVNESDVDVVVTCHPFVVGSVVPPGQRRDLGRSLVGASTSCVVAVGSSPSPCAVRLRMLSDLQIRVDRQRSIDCYTVGEERELEGHAPR